MIEDVDGQSIGMGRPSLSIIVPCRNERDYIRRCLNSLVLSSYPESRLEVIVADGMSDDGTRPIIQEFAKLHTNIRLLDNPERTTPAALNAGVRAARGEVIARIDAHAEYPPDYLEKLVDWLERSGADNVGGVCQTVPGSDTATGLAIANALSHPLGVGNSFFRIGASQPRWVDTVPFGCYRREVFDRIGLFDEDLLRNQDDEFNHRLLKAGGRILLVPEIVSRYFARDSLRQLWRMYFQYGYFKPLVIKKLGVVHTARQLVPATFVLSLGVSALLAPWFAAATLVLAVILGSYSLAILGAAVTSGLNARAAGMLCLAFPTMHFAYGFGFLKGVVEAVSSRGRGSPRDQDMPLSR